MLWNESANVYAFCILSIYINIHSYTTNAISFFHSIILFCCPPNLRLCLSPVFSSNSSKHAFECKQKSPIEQKKWEMFMGYADICIECVYVMNAICSLWVYQRWIVLERCIYAGGALNSFKSSTSFSLILCFSIVTFFHYDIDQIYLQSHTHLSRQVTFF